MNTATQNNTGLEIETTLVISTCHITEKDDALMASHAAEGSISANLMCDTHRFGHVVILSDEIEEEIKTYKDDGFSEDFVKCIQLGIDTGVRNIRFDSDGSEYPFLNKNEW